MNQPENSGRTVRVQAQALRVGDWLVGSGRLVTEAPSAGISTPTGKIDVGIDGYRRTWGKYTQIVVRRSSAARVYRNGPIPVRDVAGEWDRRDEEGHGN